MRIALLGGIFGDAMGTYSTSPLEATLRRFLAEAGHEVIALSTHSPVPLAESADVYHAHHFGTGTYHLALARVGPLVFTPQNPFLISDFDETESRADRFLQGRVFAAADALVLNSEREADRLARRFGIDRAKVTVIPSGLDLSLYGPGEGRADGVLDLVAVGQLAEYKGHRYLLEAVARLAPRFPTLRLTIVTHRRDLQAKYERRAAELGIADRLALEGPLATPELAARLRRCDVFVQPSLAECFPVTVLEAMACGKPVVATDVGGMPEEIGDAGVILPPGDAEALAGALEPLLADEARRRALGAKALERVRRLYDGREIARRVAEVYERVLDRRRRPGRLRRAAALALLAAYERKALAARVVPAAVRRRRVR